MNIDIVRRNRDLRRYGEKSSFDAFFQVAFAMLLIAVTYIYRREASFAYSDIALQGNIAAAFNFLDLNSIIGRVANPFWHINFAVLYRLGLPFVWAAAAVCVAYKMLGFLLVQRIIFLYLVPETSAKLATLMALVVMFVTAIRIPSVNPAVFAGVGSPTVWHNPAQTVALFSSLLCLPYAVHCVYTFRELRDKAGGQGVTLPWKQAAVLSALLLFSVVCKPAFMQVFLPACAAYFLVLWVKHPGHSRFFLQILLAFLPAAVCFLLQFPGFTGEISVSLSFAGIWFSVRNMLMMAAFPLFVLLITARKDAFRDPAIALCLLIAAAGTLEATLLHETGMSENSAAANWAGMNAAFLLWIFMLPRFAGAVFQYRYERQRLQEDANRGTLPAASLSRTQTRLNLQSSGFLVAIILLLWHLYSAIYYLYYLFSTGSVF